LALPAPFGRQLREACDPKAVWQTAINGGFDKIGRQERQRYRHIDFARRDRRVQAPQSPDLCLEVPLCPGFHVALEHTGGQVQTRELTGRILKGELQPPKDEDA